MTLTIQTAVWILTSVRTEPMSAMKIPYAKTRTETIFASVTWGIPLSTMKRTSTILASTLHKRLELTSVSIWMSVTIPNHHSCMCVTLTQIALTPKVRYKYNQPKFKN